MKFMLLLSLLFSTAAMADESCPAKTQKVLVIDLKSGWWAGDGGQFGTLIKSKLEEECSTIKIEYRHSTYGGYGNFGGGFGGFGGFGGNFGSFDPNVFNNLPNPLTNENVHEVSNSDFETLNQIDPTKEGANKFPKDPFSSYSQIWLLSGGEADSVDLRIESAEFKRYLKGMVESGANLFVGTGFGNVYHANALSRGLGLGNLFETDKIANIFPHWSRSTAKKVSSLEVESDKAVFEGITSLADDMFVGNYTVEADRILTEKENVLLRKDGAAVLAEVKLDGRKLFLDSGMHRFYNIFTQTDDGQSKRLLKNIIKSLSR